jgi:hypothetical protein
MKYKLIKLPKKNIIVSDDELSIGKYCYGEDIWQDNTVTIHQAGSHDIANQYPKVIAGHGNLPLINFGELSKKDCKKIGLIDIEALAYKNCKKVNSNAGYKDFIDGFKMAQSLNNKKFDVEDMGRLWQYVVDGAKKLMLGIPTNIGTFDEYIANLAILAIPKIFDIEIETIECGYKEIKNKKCVNCNVSKTNNDECKQIVPARINNSIKITNVL